jgi:PAS domain S-box-containing protein
LLGVLPDMMFLLDASGVLEGYRARRDDDLAMPPEEFLGRKASEVLPPHVWVVMSAAVERACASGSIEYALYEMSLPAGRMSFEARVVARPGGGATVLVRDMTEWKRAEQQMRRQAELLDALRIVHTLSLHEATSGPTFELLLDVLLKVTGSELGFIGEIEHSAAGEPLLKCHAISTPPQGEETEAFRQRHAPGGMVFSSLQTLFGSVILTGEPLLSNDVAVDPRRDGAPDGHLPLRSFLGVPFLHDGQMVGMVGVANRPGGYDQEVIALLSPLLHSCAHLIVTCRHEQARRKAEAARAEAQAATERFRRLFEISNAFASLVSLEGRYVDVNPALADAFGWSIDALVGQPLVELLHPDDIAKASTAFELIAQGGEFKNLEVRHRSRDGDHRWLSLNGRRDPDHELIYVVAVDISEQHYQTQQAEERLRLLGMAESMSGLGYWLIDLTNKLSKWSYEVYRVYGVDPLAFQPSLSRVISLFHPDDRAAATDFIRIAAQQGQSFVGELRIVRPDDSLRWVAIQGQPEFDREGRVVAVFGVMQDITERKDAERRLVAAREEALAASRVKSQFLANMSHEIRTPLNGVLGAAELLGDTPMSDPQREFLEAIRTSGHALLATLNDILDISKIEAGKVELESVPFSVVVVVEETLRAFLPLARQKGIALTWSVSLDVPARVVGDPVRFRQILNNLLGNALKFTHEGSVAVQFAMGEGGAMLGRVSDTGPGIPASRRDAVFEPFTQADGSTTRKFGGTGLGLTICRELVTLMGGRIWFEDAPGGGTCFIFSLRLPEADLTGRPNSRPRVPILTPAVAPLRILIAEDNPINALIIRKLLERDGHSTLLVSTGKEALDALLHHRFDLILMDVQMPEMDGLEATRSLRSRERLLGQRVPVVALTANVMKGDEELCLQAGADAYLTKPVDRDRLKNLIHRLTHRSVF